MLTTKETGNFGLRDVRKACLWLAVMSAPTLAIMLQFRICLS